jgi:hypothetical protein
MEPYGAQRLQPVAIGGKCDAPAKRLRQAKTVAAACDQLPEPFHGKEGVCGSSPQEGLKYLQIATSVGKFGTEEHLPFKEAVDGTIATGARRR